LIKVRAAVPEDGAAISALLGQLGYPVSTRQVAERMRALNAGASDPVFVAEADDKIAGLLALHLCGMPQYAEPVMRITVLVVEQSVRRRGIGKSLMERAEQIAIAAGCGLIELTSANDRSEAHAFYRSLAYEANSLRFRKALI
jgi:GNAT superfamily N-acetyltransferase